MSGTLYLVATPIGNLSDITYRAVETLRGVDVIACEDTRQTRKLLDHYAIATPMISCHEHNERARAGEICARLEGGQSVALVSDAGTPLVSDPGYRIVQAAIERGFPVVAIPGASALLTALAASGLACGAFRFEGFLPRKRGERLSRLRQLVGEEGVVVCYEAPHRVVESLADIAEAMGDPQVAVGRELTKLHEEVLRGSASEVLRTLQSRETIRGEFTIVIKAAGQAPNLQNEPIADHVRRLEAGGLSRMDAMKTAARERGLSKRDVYRGLEENR
jgi:16S rRNA (cytidine1402-2'-O)-methyltransferase